MGRILKLLAFFIVLLIVGAIVFIALLPTDRIVQIAAQQVKDATGRDLIVRGDVSPSFYPVIGVEVEEVALSNAPWGDAANMVEAGSAKVGVELLPLISGVINVAEIRLVAPVISLEINEQGQPNWEFETAASGATAEGSGDGFVKEISLGETVIENGAVRFVDRSTGQSIELEAIDAEIALPGLDKPLVVSGAANWNGERANLDLTLTTIDTLLAGGETETTVALVSAPASFSFSGAFLPPAPGAPIEAAGDVSVASADPAAAAAWALGEAPAELAGVTDLDVKGSFAVDGTALSVKTTGGLVRGGKALSLDLSADGGAGWATERRFDVALKAVAEGLVDLAYQGAVAAPDGGDPAIDGRLDLTVANPAEAMAFAGLPPQPQLDGLTDVSVSGPISVSPAALAVDIKAGAARSGTRLDASLKAAGGAGWMEKRAFDVALNAALGGLGKLAYTGFVSAPDGGDPALDGRLDLSVGDIAGAMAFAGAPADPALADLSNLAVAGDLRVSPGGLRTALRGGVTRQGKRIDADIKADAGAGWMQSLAFNVALKATAPGLVDLSYTGAVAAAGAPRLDGRVDLNAPDLPALAAFAGAALPKGQPGAFKRLRYSGSVSTPGANQYALTISKLVFDKIEAEGQATIALGDVPSINANLTTGPLDLNPYVTEGGGEAGPGWSKEKIDLSALGAANGDIRIRAASVAAQQFQLGRSDLHAKLSGGKLDLNIRELGLYGGGVVGDITLDGARGNALAANISASSIQLLPMLQSLAGLDMIEGLGALKLNVTGQGDSLHAIMNSLGGSGSMKLNDGAIVGYNLAAMVRNISNAFTGGGKSKKTDFSEVSGTFDIRKGLLTNADFRFLGPLIRIVGQGDVNIGGQSMSFRLTPKAVTSLKGQGGDVDASGLSFPLLISGPWSNLSILPDLEGGIANLLKDPEGAIDALQGLADSVGQGDIGGVAEEALKSVTGAAAAGGAAKSLIDAAKGDEDPAKAVTKALRQATGGGSNEDLEALKKKIQRAKNRLEKAKAGGDKKKIRAARQELKALRQEAKAVRQNSGGELDDAVGALLKGLTD